ncbi:MAG: hypothetical protein ABUT39_24200 [Acidobacteriota bacterium]
MSHPERMKVWCLLAVLTASPGAASFAAESACVEPKLADVTFNAGDLEPSGMVWDGKVTLYLASDNGILARKTLAGESWLPIYDQRTYSGTLPKGYTAKAFNDFESLAIVPGDVDHLYVGIEGTKSCAECLPAVAQFDLTTGQFSSTVWKLGGLQYSEKSGMEALTFVPDKTAKGGFGGFFYAASQDDQYTRSYDLPSTPGTSPAAGTVVMAFPGKQISDFYFSPYGSEMYITYDDEHDNGNQRVDEYTRVGVNKFEFLLSTPLKGSAGVEAVTVSGPKPSVLYLGMDAKTPTITSASSSCSDIKDTQCGWCPAGATGPRPGNEKGPEVGNCLNWIWRTYNCACAEVTTCRGIEGHTKKNQPCGWCKSLNQAMPGDKNGPSDGACPKGDWIWDYDKC